MKTVYYFLKWWIPRNTTALTVIFVIVGIFLPLFMVPEPIDALVCSGRFIATVGMFWLFKIVYTYFRTQYKEFKAEQYEMWNHLK